MEHSLEESVRLHRLVSERPELYGYIYRITNNVNNKTYIGQHKPYPKEAFNKYLGGGTLILKAVKKYGVEAFAKEVIGVASTRAELNRLESEAIAREKAEGKAEYNIAAGGGVIGEEAYAKIWTTELRARQSETVRTLWESKKYREKLVNSSKAYWGEEKVRIERSRLMKNKWKDPNYNVKQRSALSRPEVVKAISESNKRTKQSMAEEISVKTQEQWHRQRHLPEERYSRICVKCVEEGLAQPLSRVELEKIFKDTRKRSIVAGEHNLSLYELGKILKTQSLGVKDE